jgi:hypothetical protein
MSMNGCAVPIVGMFLVGSLGFDNKVLRKSMEESTYRIERH